MPEKVEARTLLLKLKFLLENVLMIITIHLWFQQLRLILKGGKISECIVNPRTHPVTICKETTIATMEPIPQQEHCKILSAAGRLDITLQLGSVESFYEEGYLVYLHYTVVPEGQLRGIH